MSTEFDTKIAGHYVRFNAYRVNEVECWLDGDILIEVLGQGFEVVALHSSNPAGQIAIGGKELTVLEDACMKYAEGVI